MSTEVSFTKRAAAELSKCLNGLSVSRINPKKPTSNGSTSTGKGLCGLAGSRPINNNTMAGKDKVSTLDTTSSSVSSFIDGQVNKLNSQPPANNYISSNAPSSISYSSATFNHQQQHNNHCIQQQQQQQSDINCEKSLLFQSSRNVFKEITRSNPIYSFKSNAISSPSKRPPPQAPPKTWRARCNNYLLSLRKPQTLAALWNDSKFLINFFYYLSPRERCIMAQVCSKWRDILYSRTNYWTGIVPIIYYDELRRITTDQGMDYNSHHRGGAGLEAKVSKQNSTDSCSSRSDSSLDETFDCSSSSRIRGDLYLSIEIRGFNAICLYGASDSDVFDFASRVSPAALKKFTFGSLRCSNVTDKGLDIFLASLSQSIKKLELSGCNKVSDSGLWTSLVPNLESLAIQDCINIADDTIMTITQMLVDLKELNLQAYHVTDASMAYFGPSSFRDKLKSLQLQHCWELSNQGVLNIAHGLPNLKKLSLSGCSKITDDAIEVIAEQLRGITSLDISWCSRISDASLEYIACDLSESLTELTLDRCPHITDIGLGYLATMSKLVSLYLRWCQQIRDFGLQAICSMKSLKVLSLAGCPQLTINGLSCLVQMQNLTELELTNCPGATKELIHFLRENLPPSCYITM